MNKHNKNTPQIHSVSEYNDELTKQLDRHIGALIKRLRLSSGITQSALSHGTGVSMAQIQKYENATNRVSASRLYWFARTLRTSPNYFFDSFVSRNDVNLGLSDNIQDNFEVGLVDSGDLEIEISQSPELLEERDQLLKAYFSIKDPVKRRWYLDHIRQDSKID